MKKLFYIFLLFIFCLPVWAETFNVTCSGDIASTLQTAVNSATDGDTVSIGSGSCTKSSLTTWTNKNIHVKGAGKASTIITTSYGFSVTWTDHTKASWEISDMKLTSGASYSRMIGITSYDTTQYSYGWRVHDIDFAYGGASKSSDPFVIWGVTFGLFDNNEFTFDGNTITQLAMFQSPELPYGGDINKIGGNYQYSLALSQGSTLLNGIPAAIYYEDNTFTTTSSYTAWVDTDAGGGRVVFRKNTVVGGFLYSHWNRSSHINWVNFEIYENSFTEVGGFDTLMVFEAGTGVMYNNQIDGYDGEGVALQERRGCGLESGTPLASCNGTRDWDGNVSGGYPCLGQVGRGAGKTWAEITSGDQPGSVPVYFWRNGAEATCITGGTCTNDMNVTIRNGCGYISSGTDYVNTNTAKPGYTALTYPHPLQGSPDTTAPEVFATEIQGSGVQVVVDFTESVVTTEYDSGDFDLDCSTAGTDIALTEVSGSGLQRTYSIPVTIYNDDLCTLDYTGGANEIEDAAGNDLETFSDDAVSNESSQTPIASGTGNASGGGTGTWTGGGLGLIRGQ